MGTFPEIVTERLVLRALLPADAPEVFRMRSNADVMRFVQRPMAQELSDAVALIELIRTTVEAGDALQWAITRKDDGRFVGIIGFWRFQKEHHLAELGYTTLPEQWGQGLVSEAIAAAVDHGFRALRLHRIEAITRPANIGSVRVLEKNGFALEGHLRENIFWNGAYHDSLIFARITPFAT